MRERGAARRHGVPVLAHPVAEPRGLSRAAPGARRSCTGCSATTCSASTCSITATTSSTRSTARSSARVDYEHFAVVARRPADVRPAVPDQHRSDAVERAGRGRRAQADGGRTATPAPGVDDRAHDPRRRSARLHQGHPRPAAGVRSAARAASRSGAAASACVQVGAPSRDHLPAYQALDDEVERAASTRSTAGSGPATGCRSCIAHEHHEPEDVGHCIAPPTCAWCRRCTTA